MSTNTHSGWLQISGKAADVDALDEALFAAGALTVTLTDEEDTRESAILEPAIGTHPHWPNTVVTGLFTADTDERAVRDVVRTLVPDAGLHSTRLEDRDWVRAWLDDFHPMRFGQRLWVCPRGLDLPSEDRAEAVVIDMDPGLAFGTGTHPTTAMCLAWLDGADLRGRSVLDYGSGSGILAVAAAKLGAHPCLATDIDPQALLATTDNGRRNEVALNTVTVDQVKGRFDVVLANILAGPLESLAPTLLSHLAPGGTLILAGLLADQAEAVIAAYAATLAMRAVKQQDGWMLLVGTRAN